MRQQNQNRGRFNRNSERRYIGKKENAEEAPVSNESEEKKEEVEVKEAE